MNVWEPILAILMAITNFSIKPNPKAPAADVVLEYAVEDAGAMIHLDLQPTVIDNYPVFLKLADDPQIKAAPELRQALQQATLQAEGGRAIAKSMFGVDLTTDVTSITLFMKVDPAGTPQVVVVARGALPSDLPDRLTKNVGATAETIDGRAAATTPDGVMIGTTRSGAVLVGTRALVAPRLADSWKAPRRAKGSAWAQVATALDARPFLVLFSAPTPAETAMITRALPPSFPRELALGHVASIVTASATGISWSFDARTPELARRVKLADDGLIALMRAGHLMPRGVAELAIAALPSYAGVSADLDAAIKRKDQLLAAVEQLTGDGQFAASVKMTGNRVTLTATGKHFSDVVPMGVVLATGALGLVTGRQATKSLAQPTLTPLPTPRPTPRPAPRPGSTTSPTPPSKPTGLGAPLGR